MRHCRVLIGGFLRRWGIYLLVGLAIFSVGTNAPIELAWGLASSPVAPLFYVARHVGWLLPTLVVYALVGSLPVLLTRPLWWSRRWVATEQALPLEAETVRRSDRILALWLMLPWHVLLAVGAAAVWWRATPQQQAATTWAVGGLVVAAACSLGLSLAWMRGVRLRETRRMSAADAALHSPGSRSAGKDASRIDRTFVQPTSWISACLVSMLRRGPASGTARALAAGSAAAIIFGIGTLAPVHVGAPLALLAITTLTATAFLRARSHHDLLPLQQASLHLPLAQGRWARARWALTLVPAAAGLLAALPGVLITPGLRPIMFVLYALIVILGCAWEAAVADRPSHRTARWLFTLTLAVTLCSAMTST